MFSVRAWSTSLQCFSVGGGIIVVVQLFSPTFNLGRLKEDEIVDPWKFNLKMGLQIGVVGNSKD